MTKGIRDCLTSKCTWALLVGATASASAAVPFRVEWREGPPFPERVKGGAVGVVDGLIVAVGGMNYPWRESAATYGFNPATGQWEPLPDLPEGRAYTAGVGVGHALYLIGGRFSGATRGECFRLSRGANGWAWTRLASLSEDRGWSGVASDGDLLLCIGGNRFGPGEPMVSERSPVSTVEGYRLSDPDRGWFRLPSLPGPPRGWIAAAHARGCFFAFGGGFFKEVEGQRETLRTPEAYAFDPARGEWARLADLPGPLSGAAAVTYQDRYVLILGGYAGGKRDVFDARLGRQVGEYNDVVWAYDVETNTYTALDERLPHGVNDLRAALVNDTLYAVGGENVDPPTSNTTDHLQVGRMMAVTK